MGTSVIDRDQRAQLAGAAIGAGPMGELERRICAAAARVVGRWGVRKTTIADIAKEADCSRATVYRAFPDGKTQLLMVAGTARLDRFLDRMAALADEASDTEAVLVALLSTAAHTLAHDDALQFLLRHEPELLLPFLGFAEQDRLYASVRAVIGPHLEPFLGERAGWAAEWGARIVLSYLFNPAPGVDLAREADARRIIRRFLLPALDPAGARRPVAAS